MNVTEEINKYIESKDTDLQKIDDKEYLMMHCCFLKVINDTNYNIKQLSTNDCNSPLHWLFSNDSSILIGCLKLCFIYNYSSFWENLESVYNSDKLNSSLSDVDSIRRMLNDHEFKYIILDNWYDTGNKDSYANLQNYFKSSYDIRKLMIEN